MNLRLAFVALVPAIASSALAQGGPALTLTPLSLTLAQPAPGDATAPPADRPPAPITTSDPPSPTQNAPQPKPLTGFGEPGWWGLTVSSGYANNFQGENSFNLGSVALTTFPVRDLELGFELGGWYFNQDGADTGGATLNLLARWHFLEFNDYDWTVYADAGIGVLAAGNDVPEGGTNFNFNPRLGAGITKALGEGRRAPRLQVGVRWNHFSNARIQGDDENPGRDDLMVYIGVVFSL